MNEVNGYACMTRRGLSGVPDVLLAEIFGSNNTTCAKTTMTPPFWFRTTAVITLRNNIIVLVDKSRG